MDAVELARPKVLVGHLRPRESCHVRAVVDEKRDIDHKQCMLSRNFGNVKKKSERSPFPGV